MFNFNVIVWNSLNNVVRAEYITARNETDARNEMRSRLSRKSAKQAAVITARR